MNRDVLLKYLKTNSDDTCMEDDRKKVSDRDAEEIFLRIVGGPDMAICLKTVSDHPERYMRSLREEGLSIRQISRLTGLGVGIVRK